MGAVLLELGIFVVFPSPSRVSFRLFAGLLSLLSPHITTLPLLFPVKINLSHALVGQKHGSPTFALLLRSSALPQVYCQLLELLLFLIVWLGFSY